MTISSSTIDKILEEQIERMADIACNDETDDAVKCEAARALAMLINTYRMGQFYNSKNSPMNMIGDLAAAALKKV